MAIKTAKQLALIQHLSATKERFPVPLFGLTHSENLINPGEPYLALTSGFYYMMEHMSIDYKINKYTTLYMIIYD